MAQSEPIRVLVWDENPPHAPKEVYPASINGAVAEGIELLGKKQVVVRVANLDDPEQGCSEAALAETDVLLWWGHARHGQVSDETTARVAARVREGGMGFVALHSAHYSKTFRAVVAGNGHLKGGWRENNPPEPEHLHVCAPWHPIAKGVRAFDLEHEEMYGAPFDVPPALCTILQSHFPLDGKTFPSGLVWTVGNGVDPEFTSGPGSGIGEGFGVGRVFYFRPGHETIPTYFHPMVRKIVWNAVQWCAHRT